MWLFCSVVVASNIPTAISNNYGMTEPPPSCLHIFVSLISFKFVQCNNITLKSNDLIKKTRLVKKVIEVYK